MALECLPPWLVAVVLSLSVACGPSDDRARLRGSIGELRSAAAERRLLLDCARTACPPAYVAIHGHMLDDQVTHTVRDLRDIAGAGSLAIAQRRALALGDSMVAAMRNRDEGALAELGLELVALHRSLAP